MASDPYQIGFAQEAVDDVRSLRAFERKKILDGIEKHLRHEPSQESRSRIKKMEQPFWCQFRLRVEDFRVYYNIETAKRFVNILRVLKKGPGETLKEHPHDTN